MSNTNPLTGAATKLGKMMNTTMTKQVGQPDNNIALDLIVINEQIRKEFEDADNSLAELADDIKARGIIQPVLLRPVADGKFELVAGERRIRAAKLAGLSEVPAFVRAMTAEEASDAQLAENIHRKNLTLQEEAAKVQADLLAAKGNVEAVLKKHNKSKSWLSKMTSLLTLTDQAKRLITENISADVEVINAVKQIEKHKPEAAKKVVEELKQSRKEGSGEARKIVNKAKDEVKPPKSKKPTPQNDTIATPRNRDAEEPSAVNSIFPMAPLTAEEKIIVDVLAASKDTTLDSEKVISQLSETDKKLAEEHLEAFFAQGKLAGSWLEPVLSGFKTGKFGVDGNGAVNLAAFAQGFDKQEKFDLALALKTARG